MTVIPSYFTRLFFLILCLVTSFSFSEELRRVSPGESSVLISQDEEFPFQTRDQACLIHEDKEIACGEVAMATALGAVIHLTHRKPNAPLELGQIVQATNEIPEGLPPVVNTEREYAWEMHNDQIQEITTNLTSTLIDPDPQDSSAKYVLGILTHNINPHLHFQFLTKPHYSFGIALGAAVISNLTTPFNEHGYTGTLLGGLFTFGYYPTSTWRGLWVGGGLGNYRGKLGINNSIESRSVVAIYSTLGYRWLYDRRNYGIGFGLEYIALPEKARQPDQELLIPTITFELALTM